MDNNIDVFDPLDDPFEAFSSFNIQAVTSGFPPKFLANLFVSFACG